MTGDVVARNERIADSVPDVTEVEFDCGHCITDETPAETNGEILTWLEAQGAS